MSTGMRQVATMASIIVAAATTMVVVGLFADYMSGLDNRHYCLALAQAGQDIKQIPKCMEK